MSNPHGRTWYLTRTPLTALGGELEIKGAFAFVTRLSTSSATFLAIDLDETLARIEKDLEGAD